MSKFVLSVFLMSSAFTSLSATQRQTTSFRPHSPSSGIWSHFTDARIFVKSNEVFRSHKLGFWMFLNANYKFKIIVCFYQFQLAFLSQCLNHVCLCNSWAQFIWRKFVPSRRVNHLRTGATLGESTFPKFPDKTLRTVYSRRQKKLAHVQISTSRVTLFWW